MIRYTCSGGVRDAVLYAKLYDCLVFTCDGIVLFADDPR